MIARRDFFPRLLGSLLAAVLAPVAAWATTKPKHPPHTTATPPADLDPATAENSGSGQSGAPTRLRLWKATDAPDKPVQIRFLLPDKPDSEALSPLTVEDGSYQFSNYVSVPAGAMVAEVSAPGRTTVRLPLQLVDGGQSTLLVRAQGTSLTIEWIDDTPGAADGDCEFAVYNLLAASGEIQVDLGTVLTVHLSSARSCLRLRGIKKANYPVVSNGIDGNGKNFRWDANADFRQIRKATLLIYPDSYGRIRPRIDAA